MNTGLLWYDRDPKIPFARKVREAADRYREKYGVDANTCYVNPATLPPAASVPGLELRTRTSIRPDHFWVGVSADAQPAPAEPATIETLPAAATAPPRRKRRAA